jgi:RNA polymerase sigma-70 factor (ECF subfamily)
MALERSELATDEENILERTELQAYVRNALWLLDEERRVIILLRDFQQLDYDAIAHILQIPTGTVRSRLHRARSELKTILQSKAAELGYAEPS